MAAGDRLATLAQEFGIYINNSPRPIDAISADLISIQVLDDADAMSMASITLTALNSADVKPKWIDDDRFREGNTIKIEMGFPYHTTLVFNGEITGLEPNFPEMGTPTLTVRGYDRRHRLMRQRKTRSFTNLKDSDIASQIARESGL